jgi:hypothetical protein
MSDANLSLHEVLNYIKERELNIPLTVADEENKVISLLVKTDKQRVIKIKNSKRVSVEAIYTENLNGITIIMAPMTTDLLVNTNYAYEVNGVAALIDLNGEQNVELLKKVVDGNARIEFYVISEDLSEISIKPIFNSELSKAGLKRSLIAANIYS